MSDYSYDIGEENFYRDLFGNKGNPDYYPLPGRDVPEIDYEPEESDIN